MQIGGFLGKKHWNDPKRWNIEAQKLKIRKRVFCASMADVFEDRKDLRYWRKRLWQLIEETNWLDWLLLTKRPENIKKLIPWNGKWPPNVWVGVSIENQEMAEMRVPILVELPAVLRFVSCEPILGPLDLTKWLSESRDKDKNLDSGSTINWVIVGGESGPRGRPMDPLWVRSLRDQCIHSQIPFNFKQWGTWGPLFNKSKDSAEKNSNRNKNSKLIRLGKKKAGREIDGREWDEIPELE